MTPAARPRNRHVALLRAVNLAGKNQVRMPDLCAMLDQLGLGQPRSLLQSGNLLFDGDGRSPEQLETALAAAARKQLGLDTDFFVRTDQQWQAIVAANPFPAEAKSDPGHLVVVCLKDAPARGAVAALQAAIKGREVVKAKGKQAFAVYPDGIGRSKLTAALMEKHLGTRGTGRNWNTVLKLAALL
jgi:uncharacterized protein (DUF1697 family)